MSDVLTSRSNQNNSLINHDWNVIDENGFKERVRMVFKKVSEALVNTLGPYGSTTIIEKFGEMHITKDGWGVLKKIHFGDPINNNIMQLLVNISAQVVLRVGDGSTSSIVAANSILEQLEHSDDLKNLRPKEFMSNLAVCVEKIAKEILNRSTQVYKEHDATFDEIYKLAMISTNGDSEISKMIQQIYKETNNPSIEFVKSKTNRTYYEIIDGYKIDMNYIDPIFATNDEGTCEIENPMIIMFDHKIDVTSFEAIIAKAIEKALSEDRRLVVIAPYYDKFLLQTIANRTNMEVRATGKSTVVYAKSFLINNQSQLYYGDFCMMTGALMITEAAAAEIAENKLTIDEFIGAVNKISIGPKTTTIQGFYNRKPDTYKMFMNDAIAKYKTVEENHFQLGVINSALYDCKQRISKLKGLMGIINVGGGSSLEKTSNYDLVEDAVKACESAYNYGYNIGGNLIIPIVIRDILRSEPPINLTDEDRLIYNLLDKAFCEVFYKVLANKYRRQLTYTEPKGFFKKLFSKKNEVVKAKEKELRDIIEGCIDRKQCFDLITNKYSNDIINSCYTDIEILRAATSIVSLLISSNQYISINVTKEDE